MKLLHLLEAEDDLDDMLGNSPLKVFKPSGGDTVARDLFHHEVEVERLGDVGVDYQLAMKYLKVKRSNELAEYDSHIDKDDEIWDMLTEPEHFHYVGKAASFGYHQIRPCKILGVPAVMIIDGDYANLYIRLKDRK